MKLDYTGAVHDDLPFVEISNGCLAADHYVNQLN